jgi:hypothetical protein
MAGLEIPTDVSFRSAQAHGAGKGSAVLIPTDDPDTVRVAAAATHSDPDYGPDFDLHLARGGDDRPPSIARYGAGGELVAEASAGLDGVASVSTEIQAEPGDTLAIEPDFKGGHSDETDYQTVTVAESDLNRGDPIEALPADYELSGIPEAFNDPASTPPANATEGIVEALLSVPGVSVPDGTEPTEPEPEQTAEERAAERRQLRESLDETIEAEGYNPDEWNTDARSDGTLILQDPETNRTRTIEAGDDLDSTVDSFGGDSDVQPESDDGGSGEQGGDGLDRRAIGAGLIVAAAAAYGVLQK